MSSTTRMLVLGVVRLFQPVHGYDVRRELMTWHADEWANAAPGSIYSALKSATADGSLEIVGTAAVGGRPERTTYRLTTRGELELSESLRETWWKVRTLVDPMVAAVSMLGFMDRADAIAALEARIAMIEGHVRHIELMIETIDDKQTPANVREMMRLIAARSVAEIEWARAFLVRLRAGEYRTLGDPSWVPHGVLTSKATRRGRTTKTAVMTKASAKPKAPAKPKKPGRKRRA